MANARLIFGGVSVGLTAKGGIGKPALRKLLKVCGEAIDVRQTSSPGAWGAQIEEDLPGLARLRALASNRDHV